MARIGDDYRDQARETGHRDRPEDLDLIADLGLRTLRYPAVWETIAPDNPDVCDWSWHDARFARLRELEIAPIAGLMHHGSGPRYTSLLDPAMPALLATHAARVAERYPFIAAYTPVNEPGTTARFSGLYGHWFPHISDEAACLRMLAQQCRASQLAMRAVRRVRPDARLVQTEDVGRTFGTRRLADQVRHDNERRWLSLDLLCGRIDRSHPWHRRLLASGVSSDDLAQLMEGDAAPDIIGINYYATSDRYLDGRIWRYPVETRGGNGRQRYADVEAVRVPACAPSVGFAQRLAEVWERYRRPIAVTEAHLGGDAAEQLRWLAEAWTAATRLRASGADVRAVTVWSMFGAVDWDSLLVRRGGHYEPGVFDMRTKPPSATPLAAMVRNLVDTGELAHPALAAPGWWRRHDRFFPGIS